MIADKLVSITSVHGIIYNNRCCIYFCLVNYIVSICIQVIYARNVLSLRQVTLLQRALEGIDYCCGMSIEDGTDDPVKHIFNKVRTNLILKL